MASLFKGVIPIPDEDMLKGKKSGFFKPVISRFQNVSIIIIL